MATGSAPVYSAGGYGSVPPGHPQAPPYPQGGQTQYPHGGPPGGSYQQGAPPPIAQGAPPPVHGAPPPVHGAPPPVQGMPPMAQGAPPPGQYEGVMPNSDLKDDPNVRPVEPSAPPVEKMDTVSGYENIGFQTAYLPPPSYDEIQPSPPERREFQNSPTITDEDAREALLSHVAEHCCYGSNAARDMAIKDLTPSSAFHYTLETYGEARATSWAYEPFNGQPIDGPHNGPAPGPWEIAVQAPAMFQNGKIEVEVPHTASVKPCHQCLALGRIRCYRCHGRGRLHCLTCNGTGRESYYESGDHHHRNCHWCDGSGRRRCYTCNGFGQVTCTTCQGNANLKCYIKLTITWTDHMDDHIVERTALPSDLIRSVSGQVAFEESQIKVWPINNFPDPEVNRASNQLINQHSRSFTNERILMQKQRVRIIPVTQVAYTWRDRNSSFFVYGFERKVHAPDYPQKCCCGCTIL